MRLPDPGRSRVLLIGAAGYDHLPGLPAVANNLTALAAALSSPDLGGIAAENVGTAMDPRDVRDLYERIAARAAEAEDTLLVYFAGHGLLGRGNELYLALSDTKPAALPVTGLAFDLVRHLVLDSPARNRVVILDCCFSGTAVAGMAGDEAAIVDQMGIEGTYVLAATPATRQALAPEGETYTAFTGMLLDVLRDGVPGGGELLTLRDVYVRVRREAKAKGRPEPQVRGTGTVDSLALARNTAWRAPDVPTVLTGPVVPTGPTLPTVPAGPERPRPAADVPTPAASHVPGPEPVRGKASGARLGGNRLPLGSERKTFDYRANFTHFVDLGDTWEELEAERTTPPERFRAVGRLVWWTFLSGIPQLVLPVLVCTGIGFAVGDLTMRLSFAVALLTGVLAGVVVTVVRVRRVVRLGTAYMPPLDEWLEAVPHNASDWWFLLLRWAGWLAFLVAFGLATTAKEAAPAGSPERLAANLERWGALAVFLVACGVYAWRRFKPWDGAYQAAKREYLGEAEDRARGR